MLIRVCMRTAVRKEVTSLGTFVSGNSPPGSQPSKTTINLPRSSKNSITYSTTKNNSPKSRASPNRVDTSTALWFTNLSSVPTTRDMRLHGQVRQREEQKNPSPLATHQLKMSNLRLLKRMHLDELKRLTGLVIQVETAEHAWVHWRSLYVSGPEGNQVEVVCFDASVLGASG